MRVDFLDNVENRLEIRLWPESNHEFRFCELLDKSLEHIPEVTVYGESNPDSFLISIDEFYDKD